ncbi:ribonuclease P [Candidatus Woesearchaeota archaeon]|nr:ribonuclease P [Candidatus Woesearchaeota archaeon]
MKKKYLKELKKQKSIAGERIKILFEQAEAAFNKDPSLSDRYVELARKIAMKCKLRIPTELKRRFCRHCYCYLVPGKNCRVRTHEGKVVYYCFNCKKHMRFPYTKEKKKR